MNSAIHNGGGVFLLVDLLDCQLICQHIWRVRKSSGRNGGIFLQADLLTLS